MKVGEIVQELYCACMCLILVLSQAPQSTQANWPWFFSVLQVPTVLHNLTMVLNKIGLRPPEHPMKRSPMFILLLNSFPLYQDYSKSSLVLISFDEGHLDYWRGLAIKMIDLKTENYKIPFLFVIHFVTLVDRIISPPLWK